MKQSVGLRFAETSISVKNIREEKFKNRFTIRKELNWNNYEKIRVVGKGAFGTAVLYRKKPFGLLVVLKEINMSDLNASERQLAINEVKVLSILNHPNIISYYDSFDSNGDLFIEMEYADAGTLADFLAKLTTPLQEHEILLIFRQIVSAITYLHENNILHRDIKTANIFLNKEGYIKVGDFGISKMLTSRRDAETVVGTPYYISPEICEGKFYNQKSDIWALGCVLYEMACLQKTFEGSNLPALINKIVKGQFTPVKRNYSLDFRNLIKELLQKNPELRPNSYTIMKNVTSLLNKLQLDRYRVWSQYQNIPTTIDHSTGVSFAPNNVNSSMKCANRSIVYEVKLNEPNIKLVPVLLPSKQRIKEISKSSTHFLALSYSGIIYSWGNGIKGQLGLGDCVQTIVEKAKPIESIRNRNITQICAGDGFSVFVSKNGLVMTCGDNESGCLGRSDVNPCFIPKIVDALLSADVSNVSCGPNHVVVVTGEGKVYSWGSNIDGRLGIGGQEFNVPLPTIVSFADQVVIKNVFCGPDSTALIDENGSVWMCGNNLNNKLGLNERHQFRTIKVPLRTHPTKLKWLRKRVLSISLGKNHSSFLIEDGKLITCGSNWDSQLGMGHVRALYCPHLIKQLSEHTIIKVQTGSCFTIASNDQNILYFWGSRYIRGKGSTSSEHLNNETDLSLDAIKLGDCNQSLMNVIESVGPDFPIIQIRDPQIIIDNLNDLSLLTSTSTTFHRDIILKPQAIVSIYASPVSLNHGEIIGLSNIYCFTDDTIYIIIDTTIPLGSDSIEQTFHISHMPAINEERFSSQSQSTLSENMPEWIRKEIIDGNEISFGIKKSNSLPEVFQTNNTNNTSVYEENILLKEKLEESKKENVTLQTIINELQQQNERLKIREQQISQKMYYCNNCIIQ